LRGGKIVAKNIKSLDDVKLDEEIDLTTEEEAKETVD
jgi:hypothetical protein